MPYSSPLLPLPLSSNMTQLLYLLYFPFTCLSSRSQEVRGQGLDPTTQSPPLILWLVATSALSPCWPALTLMRCVTQRLRPFPPPCPAAHPLAPSLGPIHFLAPLLSVSFPLCLPCLLPLLQLFLLSQVHNLWKYTENIQSTTSEWLTNHGEGCCRSHGPTMHESGLWPKQWWVL